MILDLLARLERWLGASRPEYFATLRPGVSADQLDEVERRFGLRLPEAFRQLYQWRDGQDGYDSLQHNRMLMPLENAVSAKEMLDDMIGADFEAPEWWRREWIPFLENGAGDHLVVDFLGIDGGQPGQIVAFWHDWENRSVKHPSFEAWLRDLVESMENGTLKVV